MLDMQAKLEEILRHFGADTGALHLLEGGVLHLRAHVGLPPKVVELISRVPLGKGMAGLAAERNEPVSSCNIQTDATGNVRPGARQTGVNGAIVVPVRGPGGAAVGSIGIGVHRVYEYTDEETRGLIELALPLGAEAARAPSERT